MDWFMSLFACLGLYNINGDFYKAEEKWVEKKPNFITIELHNEIATFVIDFMSYIERITEGKIVDDYIITNQPDCMTYDDKVSICFFKPYKTKHDELQSGMNGRAVGHINSYFYYSIASMDIVLNSNTFGNPNNILFNEDLLYHTIAHELLHVLGLIHHPDENNIMYPVGRDVAWELDNDQIDFLKCRFGNRQKKTKMEIQTEKFLEATKEQRKAFENKNKR